MQTELDLLNLIIKINYKSKEAFAEILEMSRQNLNYLMRTSEQKYKGYLSLDLKQKLKEKGIDLHQYKNDPTLDFTHASEPNATYASKDTKIIQLLEDKISLLTEKLEACEMEKRRLKKNNAT